jgi:diadenosine tetraphosphate (Ap4A) HIT family hydrolase
MAAAAVQAGPVADCVFCTRAGQPAVLFETESLYAMPDKFPMVPGHTLVIAKQHLACFGAATEALLQELETAAARVERFLRSAYGPAVFAWENGVAGQTVFHAHLHLLPVPETPPPPDLYTHPDALRVTGWGEVRRHYDRHGCYHYWRVGGDQWVIAGMSELLGPIRRLLAQATGLRHGPAGWLKQTTPADVAELARRWSVGAGRAARSPGRRAGTAYGGIAQPAP